MDVTEDEARYIVQAVRRYYGDDAVVRAWSGSPQRLDLHVETDRDIGLERHECLGLITCEIVRDHVSLQHSIRGQRIDGGAKHAYRHGRVLAGSDAPGGGDARWQVYVQSFSG